MSSIPTDPADERWLLFLATAISGLREAARRIRGELRPHYEGRTGWFGRPRAKGGERIPTEPAISQALVEVLRRMRAAQLVEGLGPAAGLDLARLEFGTEVPRRHEGGIGTRALPTDIMIAVAQDDLDLRVEAKNVLSDADLRREYMGDRGLRRFDDVRSPYSSERYGAMLAYVVDGDAAGWTARIATALPAADPAFVVVNAVVAGESLVTTRHDRTIDSPEHGLRARRVTDVLHLVLEFDADPDMRATAGAAAPVRRRP